MASKTVRVFALVTALLFFVTSVGFSGMVLWQAWQDDKQNKAVQDATKALEDKSKQADKKEGQLQGTKLQGFTPVTAVDKLETVDLQEGTGEEVKPGATVTAHYTGAIAKDGTVFESSHDSGQPASFGLGQVIQGWQQGVPGMKVGGKRRLIIPAALAYGEAGSPPKIGPNEPLVFDIELTAVKN